MEIIWRGTIPSSPNLNEVLTRKGMGTGGKIKGKYMPFPYNSAKQDYSKFVENVLKHSKLIPEQPIDTPVYITFDVSFPLTRLNSDVDNRAYAKWILDALVKSGVLIEDNQFVIPMPPHFLPGNYSSNCKLFEFSEMAYPGLKGLKLGMVDVVIYRLGIDFSWGELKAAIDSKKLSKTEQRTIMKKLDLLRNGLGVAIANWLAATSIDFREYNRLFSQYRDN